MNTLRGIPQEAVGDDYDRRYAKLTCSLQGATSRDKRPRDRSQRTSRIYPTAPRKLKTWPLIFWLCHKRYVNIMLLSYDNLTSWLIGFHTNAVRRVSTPPTKIVSSAASLPPSLA